MLWIHFITCAVLILVFGSRLSYYADLVSRKGFFSAGFMGIFFLAVITSCPEIFASLGSITLVNAPDMATGNLIGAVILNIFVIALMAISYKKMALLGGRNMSNILSAVLTALMLGIIIGFVSLRVITDFKLGIFNIGIDSLIIGLIYIIGIRVIYNHEARNNKHHSNKEKVGIGLWAKFLVSAAIIIVSGLWLARTGKAIVEANHWNEMIMGLTLMAIVTIMPEMVVSLSALKLNSVDMAVGNLVGSNFFNIFIITILDIAFRKGEFLSFVSSSNIYPAFLAVILTSIMAGVMWKKPKNVDQNPA